jgi:hypothetical protein
VVLRCPFTGEEIECPAFLAGQVADGYEVRLRGRWWRVVEVIPDSVT